MGDEELFPKFAADIMALEASGAVMPFELRPHEAMMLLGLLQLALRHPNIDDYAPNVKAFALGLAQNIEQRISRTPALAEVARRGWETSR